MKLEDQVCSLELAKRLKELGVKQESFWKWHCSVGKKSGNEAWYLYPSLGFSNHNAPSGRTHTLQDESYSAFTVAELGGMLPIDIFSGRVKGTKSLGEFYGCFMNDQGGPSEYEMTEADARAKCLIYLIENGIVKP